MGTTGYTRVYEDLDAVDSGAWEVLVRAESVEYNSGYMQCRLLDPSEGVDSCLITVEDERGAFLGAVSATMPVDDTWEGSHPSQMLSLRQRLRDGDPRVGPLEDDIREFLARNGDGCTLEAVRNVLESSIDPVLVVRGEQNSKVIIEPSLVGGERGRVLSDVIEATKDRARAIGCRAVAFPYVQADAQELRQALERAGFQGGLTTSTTMIDLSGCNTRDDFIARLPTKKRKNIRREIRRFEESGLQLRELDPSVMVDSVSRLEYNTWLKFGSTDSFEVVKRRIENVVQRAAPILRPVGCFLDGKLIASVVSFRGPDSYFCATYGADYDHMPRDFVYPMLIYYEPASYACAHGITRIYLGLENLRQKLGRGATRIPLITYIWTPDDEKREIVREWLAVIDRRNHEAFG